MVAAGATQAILKKGLRNNRHLARGNISLSALKIKTNAEVVAVSILKDLNLQCMSNLPSMVQAENKEKP